MRQIVGPLFCKQVEPVEDEAQIQIYRSKFPVGDHYKMEMKNKSVNDFVWHYDV
jgi:hypothetical protein